MEAPSPWREREVALQQLGRLRMALAAEFGTLAFMLTSEQLQGLGEAELRALAQGLLAQITERDGLIAERDAEIALRQAQLTQADSEMLMKDRKLVWSEARIDQLTHEIAVLKRWKFSARTSNSTLRRRTCSTRLSMPTLPPSNWNSSCSERSRRPRRRSTRSGHRCRLTCRARRSITNPPAPPASAAASSSASART